MIRERKTILTLVLLVLVLLLGGSSIYMAIRLSTKAPVAPTAPASEPQAYLPGENCAASGGACMTTDLCAAAGGREIILSDCASGKICCDRRTRAENWKTCNTLNFAIACTPRPDCLDLPVPCSIPEPVGGWCPVLECSGGKKLVYEDETRNSAGSYYLTTQIPEGGTIYQGQTIVISIPYMNRTSTAISSATITDVLDSRFSFLDADKQCRYASSGNKVTCVINNIQAGAKSQVSFRVKVKTTATAGEVANKATILTSDNSNALCFSNQEIQPEPKANVTCGTKLAQTEDQSSNLSSVTANQTFVYSFNVGNSGNTESTGYTLRDILTGDNKNLLTYVGSNDGCTYESSSRTVSCPVSLAAGAKKTVSFKVKVSSDVETDENRP